MYSCTSKAHVKLRLRTVTATRPRVLGDLRGFGGAFFSVTSAHNKFVLVCGEVTTDGSLNHGPLAITCGRLIRSQSSNLHHS
jgi:hypothetical protein